LPPPPHRPRAPRPRIAGSAGSVVTPLSQAFPLEITPAYLRWMLYFSESESSSERELQHFFTPRQVCHKTCLKAKLTKRMECSWVVNECVLWMRALACSRIHCMKSRNTGSPGVGQPSTKTTRHPAYDVLLPEARLSLPSSVSPAVMT